jgi:hypothetical protein
MSFLVFWTFRELQDSKRARSKITVQNFRGERYGIKMDIGSPIGCNWEEPTRSDSLAAWGMPVPPPSWLWCHRSSSLWLRIDLKPTIKRVPLWVAKGGGGEIENTEIESLPAAGGEDWRGEMLLESPPEGSFIPPLASPSTPPSISAPSPSPWSTSSPHSLRLFET